MKSSDFQALLPSSARAVLTTLLSLMQSPEVEGRIKPLWDPLQCPAVYLPWLAWALSVDEWDDSWSDAVKREVINQAFLVHRYKGTPAAIEQALASLNIDSEIKEWWELPDGKPGTATVWALINDNLGDSPDGLLSKIMLERVLRIIAMVKRGSIHVDLKLGLSFKESIAFSALTSPATALMNLEGKLSAVVPDEIATSLAVQGNCHSTILCRDLFTDGLGIVPDSLSTTLYCDGQLNQTQMHEWVSQGVGITPSQLEVQAGMNLIATRFQLQSFEFAVAI